MAAPVVTFRPLERVAMLPDANGNAYAYRVVGICGDGRAKAAVIYTPERQEYAERALERELQREIELSLGRE